MKLLILFLSVLISANLLAKEKKILRIGFIPIKDHINYNSIKDKNPSGPGVEYTEALFKKMGYEVDWISIIHKKEKHYFVNNHVDVALGLAKSKERFEYLNYPNDHVLEANYCVVSSKGKPISLKQLNNSTYKILYRSQFILHSDLEYLRPRFIEVEGLNVTARSFKMIKERRAKALLMAGCAIYSDLLFGNFEVLTLEQKAKFYITFSKKLGAKIVESYDALVKDKKHPGYLEFLSKRKFFVKPKRPKLNKN